MTCVLVIPSDVITDWDVEKVVVSTGVVDVVDVVGSLEVVLVSLETADAVVVSEVEVAVVDSSDDVVVAAVVSVVETDVSEVLVVSAAEVVLVLAGELVSVVLGVVAGVEDVDGVTEVDSAVDVAEAVPREVTLLLAIVNRVMSRCLEVFLMCGGAMLATGTADNNVSDRETS